MWEWFAGLDPIRQALLAGGMTWLVTALGAATVFLRRQLPQALLDAMLGFAAAAVIGAAAVTLISPILPCALSFAAGAMLYVVVEELLPAAQRSGRTDLVTSATMIGFAVMMALDVALG